LGRSPKAGRIIIYCSCKAGEEDGDAYFMLRDNGYRNAAVMEEGFAGWLRRNYLIESGTKKIN
jgi:rhodanese-related sulfurtransferase